jgi:hypothetical protein
VASVLYRLHGDCCSRAARQRWGHAALPTWWVRKKDARSRENSGWVMQVGLARRYATTSASFATSIAVWNFSGLRVCQEASGEGRGGWWDHGTGTYMARLSLPSSGKIMQVHSAHTVILPH